MKIIIEKEKSIAVFEIESEYTRLCIDGILELAEQAGKANRTDFREKITFNTQTNSYKILKHRLVIHSFKEDLEFND